MNRNESTSHELLLETTQTLGLQNQADILSKHWNASCESFPSDIIFLSEAFIRSSNRFFGFPPEVYSLYKRTAEKINQNRYLKVLFWHMHQILFNYNEAIDVPHLNRRRVPMRYSDTQHAEALLSSWPSLESSLGELSPMFAVVVFASGLDRIQEFYHKKGIPEQILIDTLDDLLRWIQAFHRKHGKYGFSELHWLYRHFTGRLFRLGRLQFEPIPFPGNIVVYKNISSGKIMVLSKKDMRYRRDGQVDGASGIYDAEGVWISRLEQKEGKVFGNPISSNSGCSSQITVISEDEWIRVLDEKDAVLNVHIPEGSKLDHEQCIKSYNEALTFFKKYFPETNFKAFVCYSWLLDVQLKDILPAESNIAQFLGDFVVFPVDSPREAQVYERVFGKYSDTPAHLPENTFLQKSIKKYLVEGNFMRNGAGFILI